jgi:hypothetical protein
MNIGKNKLPVWKKKLFKTLIDKKKNGMLLTSVRCGCVTRAASEFYRLILVCIKFANYKPHSYFYLKLSLLLRQKFKYTSCLPRCCYLLLLSSLTGYYYNTFILTSYSTLIMILVNEIKFQHVNRTPI